MNNSFNTSFLTTFFIWECFNSNLFVLLHLLQKIILLNILLIMYYIYIYALCSLGIEPTTFALLTQCSNHWATGTEY